MKKRKLGLGLALGFLVAVSGLALTQLTINTDWRGVVTFARPASDTINAKSLAAGVAETETVPAGATFVIFSSTADFYAKTNATATVPGDVADGTASELNPAMWTVTGGTTISVIAPAATVVTFTYYKKQ